MRYCLKRSEILACTAAIFLIAPSAALSETKITAKSYQIAPGASSGNLNGTACPTGFKMISGACHPFYNDKVPIINQFPNVTANTWRCGFKNNTSSTASVWVYTTCSRPSVCTPPAQTSLAVTLRPQETGMWCWAASGQMVMQYHGVNVAQCTQANNRFGRSDCCNTPTPQACISGGWPEFDKYGFSFTRTSNTALTWDQLRAEIADSESCGNRPFAFTWHWPGGGGHMMVAIGYDTVDGVNYVEINDPWAPNVGDHRFITYDFYVESPGDHTHWDDFYEVQPN